MNDGSGNLQSLSREIPQADGPAPVHLWDPPFCGDIDMRIARDGTWYYRGSPIGRKAMVRLFSSVLRRDGDRFFLVTPVEKLGIKVDDCPFVAVAVEHDASAQPAVWRFILNNDETVPLDIDHPLRVDINEREQPHPVLMVRPGLEALVRRPVFYELVEHAVERTGVDGGKRLVVDSGGQTFELGAC